MNLRNAFLFIAIFFARSLFAQWQQVPIHTCAHIQDLIPSGDTVYAACDEGVGYSTDRGDTWKILKTEAAIYSVAVSGKTIYAGTIDDKVLATVDGGKSWVISLVPAYDKAPVTALAAIGPAIAAISGNECFGSRDGFNWTDAALGRATSFAIAGNNIVTSVGDDNLFYSPDNAATWQRLPSSPYGAYSLAQGESNLYTVGYLEREASICATSLTNGFDSYSSWKTLFSPANEYFSAVAAHGRTVYAGEYSGVLYYSSDNGSHWSKLSSPFVTAIQKILISGSRIFVRNSDTFYYSDDNGSLWHPFLATIDNTFLTVKSLLNAGTAVYAATSAGLFRSDNNADFYPSGFIDTIVYAVSFGNNTLYAGHEHGVSFSGDAGAHWNLLPGSPDETALSLLVKDSFLYAGFADSLRLFDLKRNSWLPGNLKSVNGINLLADGNTILYADAFFGTSAIGLYQSSDEGRSWNPWENTSPSFEQFSQYAYYAYLYYDSTLIFGGSDHLGLGYASGLPDYGSGLIYVSHDGSDWEYTNFNSPVRSLGRWGTMLFAGTHQGMFTSTSNGMYWSSVKDCPPSPVTAFAQDTVFLYAGTENHSIWRRPLSQLEVPPKENGIHLHSFPNPFSDNTTITFSLPEPELVTVTVSDVFGNTVITLAQKIYQEGTQTLSWNSTHIASGVYYCRIRTEDFSQTISLHLIR